MGKNYEKLGDEIITRLGGEQNITKLFHCATRLRFQLADMSKADLEGIKKLPDVMGVVESVGGVQVIIGNDVASAYAAIVAKHKIENSSDGKKVEKSRCSTGEKWNCIKNSQCAFCHFRTGNSTDYV